MFYTKDFSFVGFQIYVLSLTHLCASPNLNETEQSEVIEAAHPNKITRYFLRAAIPDSCFLPDLESSTSCMCAHIPLWLSCIYNSQEIFTWETNVIQNTPKCPCKHAVIEMLHLQQQSYWLKNFHSRSMIHVVLSAGLKQQFPAHVTPHMGHHESILQPPA